MADVGPVALEEARDVLHDRLVTLDWEPPARRYGRAVRRHAAPGARPIVPRRLRAGPGRARRPAAAARGSAAARRAPARARRGARRAGRARQRRAAAAEDRDRRGRASGCICRIRGWTSARRARACRRSTRSTSCARSPAACPITACWRRRRPTKAARAWRGRRRRDPDRAIDDLEHDLAALKPLLDARDPSAVKGHAHYLLGLNEALRRSVISRWARGRDAVVAERRPDQGGAGHAGGARRAASAARGRTRCRRCSASRRARISSCSRRSTASSRGTSPSRSCAWIR